jgi:hypothetical protein
MTATGHRPGRRAFRCTLCGREILPGEEYWACNGHLACGDCFPALARRELAPCREVRGKEARP